MLNIILIFEFKKKGLERAKGEEMTKLINTSEFL